MTRSEFASAIPGFYDRLLEDLTRVCGSRDRAQDVVQETLTSAWQNICQYRGDSELLIWVEKIAYNTYYDTQRKWHADCVPLDAAANQIPGGPLTDVPHEYESLYKAMDRLNDGERTLVHLHYYLDKSYEEMSAVTGRNVGSVRSGLYHIRMKLKRLIIRYDTISQKKREKRA